MGACEVSFNTKQNTVKLNLPRHLAWLSATAHASNFQNLAGRGKIVEFVDVEHVDLEHVDVELVVLVAVAVVVVRGRLC